MREHPPGIFPIQRRQRGWCAEGPGFYVWDEDPREVAHLVRELVRGPQSDPRPIPPIPPIQDPGPGRRPGP